MHELKLIVDLMYQGGLNYMRYSVSDTAEYGDYSPARGSPTRRQATTMKDVLTDIQDGAFAKRWIAENQRGRPEFNRMREADRDHQIEKVGERAALADGVPQTRSRSMPGRRRHPPSGAAPAAREHGR